MWVLILVFWGSIGWIGNGGGSGHTENAIRVANYVSREQCESAAPKNVKHYCIPAPLSGN